MRGTITTILCLFCLLQGLPAGSEPAIARDDNKESGQGLAFLQDNSIRQKITEVLGNLKEKTGIELGFNLAVLLSDRKNIRNIFALDRSEVYLTGTYKYFGAAALMGFDEQSAELGVAFLDVHPFGGTVAPRGRPTKNRGLHFQLGKFDLPFGIDYYYISNDKRLTVTRSLPTELVINGGYNDIGFRMLADLVWLNFTVYAVRGIEKGKLDNGNSFGAHLSFTPLKNPYTLRKKKVITTLEFGFSYVHDFNADWATEEYAMAAFFELKAGPVLAAIEYYAKDDYVSTHVIDGYQVIGGFDFGTVTRFPMTIYTRYDNFRTRENKIYEAYRQTGTYTDRIAGGLNFNIATLLIIKMEYLRFLKTNRTLTASGTFPDQSFFAQFVISI